MTSFHICKISRKVKINWIELHVILRMPIKVCPPIRATTDCAIGFQHSIISRSGAVVWGTVPQGVRSWAGFPVVSFQPHYGLGVDPATNKWVQDYFLAGKCGRWVGVTTLSPSCAESWNPGALTSWNPQGLSRCVHDLLCFITDVLFKLLMIFHECRKTANFISPLILVVTIIYLWKIRKKKLVNII